MKKTMITLVVPTIERDLIVFLTNVDFYKKNLPIKNVCIIGNEKVKELLPKDDSFFSYIPESYFFNYETVAKWIENRVGDKRLTRRTGWYLQQFIKMQYSFCCEDDFYLLWDSDTIPVRCIDLFHGKVPYMDYKTEYNENYFVTLSSILPDLKKEFYNSFISEHMLIDKQKMRELIRSIERNSNIPGDCFAEKIINSLPEGAESVGFSEFETYGTFIYKYYPDTYELRKWESFRYSGLCFKIEDLNNVRFVKWVSSRYDALSFEKNHKCLSFLRFLSIYFLSYIFSPKILDYIIDTLKSLRKL